MPDPFKIKDEVEQQQPHHHVSETEPVLPEIELGLAARGKRAVYRATEADPAVFLSAAWKCSKTADKPPIK